MGNLMVLDKDDTWLTHKFKLIEETAELVKGIDNKDKSNIAEEAFDVIQVCVGILDKLADVNMAQELLRHEQKLVSRGWRAKKIIKIEQI